MGGRVDKKIQTKPTISLVDFELVHDITIFLRCGSDGDTGRRIALTALDDMPTINHLSPYMWRDYARGDRMWIGHEDNQNLDELLPDKWERTKRFPIRFERTEWRRIDGLALALGRDKANTTAVLLRLAVRCPRVLATAAPGYAYRSQYSLRKGVFG
ncbi:hypothetical protein [Alicyclobacillus fodiniaquatilis]|uniref:Uncharacterized protein n=1 Tax=Alicyclobacillus fodiniaquatilis TaxID=1661150 RepID=A0ABW4JIM9_9BACL